MDISRTSFRINRVGSIFAMLGLTTVALGLSVFNPSADVTSKLSMSRRGFLGAAAAAAVASPLAAEAVPARTGPNSVFNGEYNDPLHQGCLRSIKVGGAPLLPSGRRSRKPQALVAGVDKKVRSRRPYYKGVLGVLLVAPQAHGHPQNL